MKTLSLLTLLALGMALPLSAQVASNNKPDPALQTSTWNDLPVVAGQLLVGFTADLDRTSRDGLVATLQGARLAEWGDTALIRLPAGADLDEALASWRERPEVTFAEADVLYAPSGVPNDLKWPKQWALQKVGASNAWDLASGDPNVVVAIIDTGALTSHPDLKNHYAYGYDTYANDADPTDTNGHGSHCTGIAAAETNNTIGIAGASHSCSFAAYRCGNGSFPSSALVSAITMATAAGAQVLSMSWGSSYNSASIQSALQSASAAGCVLVAAAGNNNSTGKSYPAALSTVISVGSSDKKDARSSFSNYGSWVDLAAPGQNIISTYKNGGYVKMSGTSMATPLVAGMATLLYSQLGGQRSLAAAQAVRKALQDSAVPVGSWVSYGRVDFAAALAALDPGTAPLPSSISPSSVAVLPQQTVTLNGSGFIGTTAVTVNGTPAPTFTVLSDSTLTFEPPLPTQFGSSTVVVHEGAQQSPALTLSYGPSDPPLLQVDGSVSAGDTLSMAFAGELNQQQLLLASLQPTTFTFKGYPLLLNHVIINLGLLDSAGSLLLSVTVPNSLSAITVQLQGVTLSGAFAGATAVASVTVAP